eukprot:m.194497 g.194497  ORF g.194497 m.194497 type:complete len:72 (+) comp10619_c1_seq1:2-217(+)
METSAKTAANVEEAFIGTARQIYQKIEEGTLDIQSGDSSGVKLGPQSHSSTGGAGGGSSGSGGSPASGGCC